MSGGHGLSRLGVVRPTLIVVSGPLASGKTTLARAVERAVRCPAICRDEIKEGLMRGSDFGPPMPGDEATRLATDVFFEVVELLVRRGVTLVAEADFQHALWAPKLEVWGEMATIRVIRCVVLKAIARERFLGRHEVDPGRRR